MKPEALKIGDKVYSAKSSYSPYPTYIITEVERITKNTAKLKNGVVITNEPTLKGAQFGRKHWGFNVKEKGNFGFYTLLCSEAEKMIAKNNEIKEAVSWFKNHQFSDEEKLEIKKGLSGPKWNDCKTLPPRATYTNPVFENSIPVFVYVKGYGIKEAYYSYDSKVWVIYGAEFQNCEVTHWIEIKEPE